MYYIYLYIRLGFFLICHQKSGGGGHCLIIAHKVKFVGLFLKIERHLYAELSYVQVNTVFSDTKKIFAFKNAGL